jgi:hypothetical protein
MAKSQPGCIATPRRAGFLVTGVSLLILLSRGWELCFVGRAAVAGVELRFVEPGGDQVSTSLAGARASVHGVSNLIGVTTADG